MGTAAARAGNTVRMYARDQEQADAINCTHRNPKVALSEFELPENMSATTDLAVALQDVDVIILSLPAQILPVWLARHKDQIPPKALLCNTAKGLYLQNRQLQNEACLEALGRDQPYAILSGPSFAKEIMLNMPTAVVVASKFLYHAVYIQRMMSTLYFRVYTSQDVTGVELGGSLKNPLAIGAGVIEGSGLGINTMAAYVTRSSLELMDLCKAMGGEPSTISGLSGIGDLMLTAFGNLSRNRTTGTRIAKGEKIEDITATTTVEGVPTAQVAVYFADKCGLELPIFRAVAGVLNGSLKIEEMHVHLMGRPLRQET
ncbi:unnamed protein product, partial [Ectocarpus fasciculatus]